jgi:hypothetical protein
MKLISHRGNLTMIQPKFENRPDFVDQAIRKGFDVEVDLWVVGRDALLGHDEGVHPVSSLWLHNRHDKLWVHCKNVAAMEMMAAMKNMNAFWHDKDDYTMTSKGYIWAYPGKPPIGVNTICVLPEQKWPFDKVKEYTEGALGICSDYVGRFK